jgi:hypothetical protein
MRTILPIVFALLVQSKTASQPKPPVTYTVFTDGDEVTARLKRPDGEVVEAQRRKPVGNLHGVRRHFVPEIIKTAENVN